MAAWSEPSSLDWGRGNRTDSPPSSRQAAAVGVPCPLSSEPAPDRGVKTSAGLVSQSGAIIHHRRRLARYFAELMT